MRTKNSIKSKSEIILRFKFVYFLALIFPLLSFGWMLKMQLTSRDKLEEIEKKAYAIKTVKPRRGDILSDNGSLLVSSIPFYDLYWDTQAGKVASVFNKQIDSLAVCMHDSFPKKSVVQWKNNLTEWKNKGRRGVCLAKGVFYSKKEGLSQFPIFNLGRYSGGFYSKSYYKRTSLMKENARKTLGKVELDPGTGQMTGKYGLELKYDSVLKGIPGKSREIRISSTSWTQIGNGNIIDPVDGYDLLTTINLEYQDIAHYELMKTLKKFRADWGTVILMDIETGHIKAMANIGKSASGTYYESYNYAVQRLVEPASIAKFFTFVVASEDGVLDTTEVFDTGNGKFHKYKRNYFDSNYKKGGNGKINLRVVFEKSSNIGTIKLMLKYYENRPDHFNNKLYELGLNEISEIDLIGETSPWVKTRENYKKKNGDKLWFPTTLLDVSYGYVNQYTPMQILTFMNGFINNGKVVRPMLVSKILNNGKTIEEFDTKVIRELNLKDETYSIMNDLLIGVVENGTATNLKSSYGIAGKTGTLENKVNGKILGYQASFCGYFPTDAPKYSMIVLVNNPDKNIGHYGNIVAGNTFKHISDFVMNNEGGNSNKIVSDNSEVRIPLSKGGSKSELINVLQEFDIKIDDKSEECDWVKTSKKADHIALSARSSNIFKRVKGMGLQDALYLLEDAGYQVSIDGIGCVYSAQFIGGSNKTVLLKLKRGCS